jgi:hypothetical protein
MGKGAAAPRPQKGSSWSRAESSGLTARAACRSLGGAFREAVELLIQQLPEPAEGTEAAAIAQLHQKAGAKPLEAGAAGNVNVSHGRCSACRHPASCGRRPAER